MKILKYAASLLGALWLLATSSSLLAQSQPQSPPGTPRPSRDELNRVAGAGSFFPPVKHDPIEEERDRRCRASDAQGMALLRGGDAGAAVAGFLQALAFVPTNILAQEHLARAYTAAGRTGEAITTYRALLYHGPNMGTTADSDPGVLMPYALLLLQTGQHLEALAVYQRGWKSLPTDRGPRPPLFTSPDFADADFTASAYTAMGLYTIASSNPNGGDPDFERAIAAEPNLAAPYFYLGQVDKFKPGRATDALAMFDQAERLGGPGMQPFVDKALKDGPPEFTTAVKAVGLAAH